jgi:tetraacyldisaccharide 4'-kinase
LAERAGFDVIVMDDGHQNFSLDRDLSLVVVDGQTMFGNNRILPAGPLREPVAQGLARADAIIVNGKAGSLPSLPSRLNIIGARIIPLDQGSWAGRRVVAFAGIGQPQNFFATLARTGAQIVEALPFADHHIYRTSELAALQTKARDADAMLVTTEKDLARLGPAGRECIVSLPVRLAFDDSEALESLLDRIVPRVLPAQAQ